jgi:hypothetical protein
MAVHRYVRETGTFSSTLLSERPCGLNEGNIIAMVECDQHQSTGRISSHVSLTGLKACIYIAFAPVRHLELDGLRRKATDLPRFSAHRELYPMILFADKGKFTRYRVNNTRHTSLLFRQSSSYDLSNLRN